MKLFTQIRHESRVLELRFRSSTNTSQETFVLRATSVKVMRGWLDTFGFAQYEFQSRVQREGRNGAKVQLKLSRAEAAIVLSSVTRLLLS